MGSSLGEVLEEAGIMGRLTRGTARLTTPLPMPPFRGAKTCLLLA